MTSVEAPRPTAIYRKWWPASVRLPDASAPIRNVKAYATPEGLYVYAQDRAPQDAILVFHSPIDFDKTQKPANSYAAAQAGSLIHTDRGVVVVQPQGGCGCNFGRLKRWSP